MTLVASDDREAEILPISQALSAPRLPYRQAAELARNISNIVFCVVISNPKGVRAVRSLGPIPREIRPTELGRKDRVEGYVVARPEVTAITNPVDSQTGEMFDSIAREGFEERTAWHFRHARNR